ncbi:uncharacterized protein DFL_002747 [Arthrobotrys flagrans]|uniref:Aminotransferase class I/classII large domain-containing protein n=1 Tax=Arthrobotrys flagrans TaxID=97331 RepID=A0A437ACI1_ARTFL|nr:hypothetical protein DFL_002747 [Arthrobotrys flagrans]
MTPLLRHLRSTSRVIFPTGISNFERSVTMASSSIDFMRGHPSTSLLATSEMLAAANAALGSPDLPRDSYDADRHPLHYGPDLGNISFRREIGIWSAVCYGLDAPTDPEMINLTSGASNGLSKALELFTNPIGGYTRRAFILTPVYFLACPIFQDAGFANLMTAISLTPCGTSLDFSTLISHLTSPSPSQPPSLETATSPLRSSIPKPLYRHVLYCVPTFSNPTGTTLSLSSRLQLVKLAREHDILLISDDVYDFLDYQNSPSGDHKTAMKRLVDIDRELGVREGEKGHTLSNCSFSKILGPGVRCGWVEGATRVLAQAMGRSGANHSGGTPCQLSSTIVHRLLLEDEGKKKRVIDDVIGKICVAYKRRAGLLETLIKEYWPEGTEVQGGDGGYFLWVKLPEGYDAREVAKVAVGRGVKVGGGDGFEVPVVKGVGEGNSMGWGGRYLRLSVSYLEEEKIGEGVRILGEVMRKPNFDR